MEANKKTKVTIETIDPTGDAADRFEADEFAGRVKQQLMQGRASWQKAREPGERVLPRSLRTGKLYTDYNSAYLSTVAEERGFRDVRWGTREQIEDQGGRIRDGEQGESLPGRTPTSEPRGLKVDMGGDSLKELYSDDYARRALIEARSTPVDPHTVYRVGFVGEDGTTDWSSAGSNKEEADRIAGDYLKSGRVPPDALPGASYSAVTKVYNAEQADGLPAPEHSRSEPLWKAHQRAEDIIRSAGVGVRHTDGDAVSYSVELDEIKIPKKERFASATDYYRTAIKQLGHAAAHPARMGHKDDARFAVPTGRGWGQNPDLASAREELRAEMAASMTCERIGLGYTPQATVRPELKTRALGWDHTELKEVASEAQKISDRLVAGGRDRAATREQNSPSPAGTGPAQSPRFTPSLPQPKVANPERLLQRSGGPTR